MLLTCMLKVMELPSIADTPNNSSSSSILPSQLSPVLTEVYMILDTTQVATSMLKFSFYLNLTGNSY